jgi:tetratricopeptide (TPR) repeat protein
MSKRRMSVRSGEAVAEAGEWARADLAILAVLAVVTVVAFAPSVRCGFTLDDDSVIAKQAHVREGLSAENVWWALSAFELGYPIPVTLWSFMADAQVFGLRASWFHAENVTWHVGDVMLLYLLLVRLTGSRWRSAVVAAVFAVHPLRVESVTWVTERKDVLAAFFGLLALHAYVSYARCGGVMPYVAVFSCFTLSLLAKPMLAMLPVMLLAIDYWPLGRMGPKAGWRKLILEKVPLVLVAGLVSLAGVAGPGARDLPVARLPVTSHVANAVVSYVRYVGLIVWPRKLSIIYPIVPHWPAWVVLGSALILLVVTLWAWREAGRRPWIFVGWIWYVVILLPASGIHVLGDFSMADRYTYFPMIGLLVMAVWSLPERLVKKKWRVPVGAVCAASVVALMVMTWRQTLVWRDNIALFSHSVQNAGPSYIACSHLAAAYSEAGRFAEAAGAYRDALDCDPGNADLLAELALVSDRAGDHEAAIAAYTRAVEAKPADVTLRYNLGTELVAAGRPAEALPHLQKVIELSPNSPQFRGNYATALLRAGRVDDAIDECKRALTVDPSAAGVRRTLASALANRGDFDGAEQQYELAILNDPKPAGAYNELGALSLARKRHEFAVSCFRRAIEHEPGFAGAHVNLGVALAMEGHAQEAAAEFKKALELDPKNNDAAANLARLNAAMNQ